MKKLIPLFMCVHAEDEDYNSKWTGEEIDSGVGIANSEDGLEFTAESNPSSNIASGSTIKALFARIAGWISKLSSHISNGDIHVTAAQKTTWNGKADSSTLTSHTGNSNIHVTAAQKIAWNGKQNALTFDSSPTSESYNPVTSGGVYTAISGKADSVHNHSASEIASGTLSVSRGGTGQPSLTSGSYLKGNGTSAVTLRTAAQALYDLISGSSSLTSSNITDDDYIGVDDVSVATGKKVLFSELITYIKGKIPYTSNPSMNGTASAGSSTLYSRGDHVHPTDTTRASATALSNHTGDTDIHVTADEKTAWNGKASATDLSSHTGNSNIHVTASEKSTWSGKQNALTFDSSPTSGSSNPVTSGGVYSAVSGKAPTSHASSETTYGVGNSSNYGHLKLSDSTSSTSGTSGGVAATPSAVKSAYDLANEKSKKVTYTGTLSSSSWSGSDSAGYTLTLTISGILATDTPVIGPVMTGTLSTDKAMLEAWSNVTRIVTAANQITCYAFSAKPEVNIPIQLMCMR